MGEARSTGRPQARRWFTATAANEPAGSTILTVQIGDRCFSHAVTQKVD